MLDTETLKIAIFVAGLIFGAGGIVAAHVGHGRQLRLLWQKHDRIDRRLNSILVVLALLAKGGGNPQPPNKEALDMILKLQNGGPGETGG